MNTRDILEYYIVCLCICLAFGILFGCAQNPTPPNVAIGFSDALEHANFHPLMTGADFQVDMQGHNYTQNGQNLNYDQMRNLFFYISPWDYVLIKNFILQYCHDRPDICTYSQVKVFFSNLDSHLRNP